MNDVPPKQTPINHPLEGGALALYPGASGSNADFPVLKAFQDYIEAERAQARKRMVALSVAFAVILAAVVVIFLAAGLYMLKDMSALQSKLLDAALNARPPAMAAVAQPVVAPSPVPLAAAPSGLEASVREMTKAAVAIQTDIGKKLDGFSEIRSQVDQKMTIQQEELGKLRAELSQLKAQSEKVKKEAVAVNLKPRKNPPIVKPSLTEDPRFPPATKAPPVVGEGVVPPSAPKGMMATALPLKASHSGSIPWRVMIPE